MRKKKIKENKWEMYGKRIGKWEVLIKRKHNCISATCLNTKFAAITILPYQPSSWKCS